MDNSVKSQFVEKSMQRLMGKILDMGRMSEMSERAFKQYERSTKIEFNNLIRLFKEEIFGEVVKDYKEIEEE